MPEPVRLTNLLVALGTEELKRIKMHNKKRYIVTTACIIRENNGPFYQSENEWIKLFIPVKSENQLNAYRQFQKGDRLSLKASLLEMQLNEHHQLKRTFIVHRLSDARSIQNYIKHGYTHQEAKEKIKQRQKRNFINLLETK